MIRAEEVELKLLESAAEACSNRNILSVKKEHNSYQIGELLYEVKQNKVAERRLGRSFEKWVESTIRDRDGRPRTAAWANNMIHGFVRVHNLPALKEFFHSGWVDENGNKKQASWATVVAAADYVAIVGYEKDRFNMIWAQAVEEGTACDEERLRCEDEANDAAGRYAVELSKTKKSHHLRADIRDHMAESPAYDSTADTRVRVSFMCDKDVLEAFREKAAAVAEMLSEDPPGDNMAVAIKLIVELLEEVADAGRVPDGTGDGDAGLAPGAPSGPGRDGRREEEAPRE